MLADIPSGLQMFTDHTLYELPPDCSVILFEFPIEG